MLCCSNVRKFYIDFMCLWGKSAQQWILSRVVELEEKGRWWGGGIRQCCLFSTTLKMRSKKSWLCLDLMQFICFKANWPALKMPRLYYDLLPTWGQSLKFCRFWRENSNPKFQMHQFLSFGAKIQIGTRKYHGFFNFGFLAWKFKGFHLARSARSSVKVSLRG